MRACVLCILRSSSVVEGRVVEGAPRRGWCELVVFSAAHLTPPHVRPRESGRAGAGKGKEREIAQAG